jgi:hypothetical protein
MTYKTKNFYQYNGDIKNLNIVMESSEKPLFEQLEEFLNTNKQIKPISISESANGVLLLLYEELETK